MRVLFVPDYSDGNPYQSNLAAALDADVTYGSEESRFPVLAALLSGEVSVVHFHWLDLFFRGESRRGVAARVCLLLARLLAVHLTGVAVVWTVHNVISHDPDHPRLERWFKRAFVSTTCDRLVVHCEDAGDRVIEELGLPPSVRSRTDVVPHGHYLGNYENEIARQEARASLGIPDGATVFLFFGLIRRYKGVEDLVAAFGDASVPDGRLVVAGKPATPSLRADLRGQIDAADRVDGLLEFVPDDEVQRYMNAADAVVLPFREVTTSGSAFLAMSFGNALVVPRLGCLPELLDDDGAVLYDRDRPGALARALETAAGRDLGAMGEYNRWAVERFDWDDIADRTRETYAAARGETGASTSTAPARAGER